MFGIGKPRHLDVLHDYQEYLVGGHNNSVGLDLVNNQLVCRGEAGLLCPSIFSCVIHTINCLQATVSSLYQSQSF